MTTFDGFPADATARATLHREFTAALRRAGRFNPEQGLVRDGYVLISAALQGSETSVSLDLSSLHPIAQGVGTRTTKHLKTIVLDLRNIARELSNSSCLTRLSNTIAAEYGLDLAAMGVR